MTVVSIDGKPAASFNFFDVITWNVFASKRGWSQRQLKQALRGEGAALASKFKMRIDPFFRELFVVDRAFVLVKVFPPNTEEISDTHNVCIKHILDGFTDGKIWEDDEWAFVPLTMFMWAGLDPNPQLRQGKVRKIQKRRTIIEIHELEALVINGVSQILPTGRRRLE